MWRIILASTLAALTLGAATASAQVVSFNPADSGTLSCGQTYTVDVEIDSGITDLRAYTLHIIYDGDNIAPVFNGSNYSSAGALVSGAACSNILFDSVADGGASSIDTLKVDVGLLGCSVNGPGSILTIEFEGLTTGTAVMSTGISVNSAPTSLRDSGNNEIAYSLAPGATMKTLCNTKPVANDDGGAGFTTNEDVAFTTDNVLDNDNDPDSMDTIFLAGFDASGAVGTVVSNGNGTFDYTPVPETSGTDSFVYFISDGVLSDTATVTIIINLVNDLPVALDDDVATDEDILLVIDVLADNGNGADYDIDDGLDPTSTVVVPATGPSDGTLINNGDGTFDYIPDPDFNGTDSFRYTVDDLGGGTSNEATVNITINAVNDPPTAQDDSTGTAEDTPVDINVVNDNGNGPDTDPDDGIHPGSVSIVSGPANGSTFVSFSSPVVTYTPDPDFNGTDVFTYLIRDFVGDSSNVATVTVTVTSVNDPPVLANPGNQFDNELDVVSVQLVASDVDLDSLGYTVTGLPAGLSADPVSGLISGQIDCSESAGSPFAIVASVTDGTDTATVNFDWNVSPALTPASVSNPAAVQTTAGNDFDGTTQITVSWSRTLIPSEVVQVYRKGFGDYPEYDDGSGAVPAQPSSGADALASGWTLVDAVTDTFLVDEPVTRDFWYYVMFVTVPGCTESGPSAMTSGTLNYHLGDFTDGTALPNPGDNTINFNDVGLFGANYGAPVTGANNVLDIGPTTGGFVDTRPTTDNAIGFEDLILFSINFGSVSKPGVGGTLSSDRRPVSGNSVRLTVPKAPEVGEEFSVRLDLTLEGNIKALSVPLLWNSNAVEPLGHTTGSLMEAQQGHALLLSPSPGTVDASVLGAPFAGEGELGTITFRVIGSGDPDIALGDIRARDAENQEVLLTTEVRGPGGPVPTVTRLLPNAPNPFSAGTVVAFDLARDSRVRLAVFGVDGRLVRTIADDHLPAGTYEYPWNGRDESGRNTAAGIYLIRFQTENQSDSRRVVRLK